MKQLWMIVLIAILCISCETKEQREKQSATEPSMAKTAIVANEDIPIMNVYNMGRVPQQDVDALIGKLETVYPKVRFAGNLQLVDSAHIKNDTKGNNRYWWSKLRPHLIKTTDTKRGITLVIANAEICNWTKNGSHANLGISNCGGHVSMVSYQRLKVNHLNNLNDMTKVAIHELGHSVARLVIEREDLRFHCPEKSCLMKDANNGYPYRGLTSFCDKCTNALKGKGFNIDALRLQK